MNNRHIRVLTKFTLKDLWGSGSVIFVFVSWLIALGVGIGVNAYQHRETQKNIQVGQAALDSYYKNLHNAYLYFTNIYTVQRPVPALGFITQGTSFLAPNMSDYLPRYSANFYYSDDVNPLLRIFKPFDLTAIVGIVGCLMALLLTYQAINGEMLKKNLYLLELSGAHASSRYLSKLLSYQMVILSTFLLAFVLVLFALGQWLQIDLASHLKELQALALVSCVHIFFSVALGLALSAIFASPAKSFSMGIAIFLFQVFVIPLICVEWVSFTHPMKIGSTDLQERKINYSRFIHRRLDPYNEEVRKKTQKLARLTPENLSTLWDEESKVEFFMFVTSNSNYAVNIDEDFFAMQSEFAARVAAIARWLSPYFALQLSIAETADVGIHAEKAMVHNIAHKHFIKYRLWFWDYFMSPLDYFSEPIHRWIFARNKTPQDIGAIGHVQAPRLPMSEKLLNILQDVLSLIFWSFICIAWGWFGSIRMSQVKE
ncbi:MAG: ABC transporter permease subunit [Bdellovibrionales bacterium]